MPTQDLRICKKRQELLQCEGHMLVLGGPGSGKTTIALLKASKEICAGKLGSSQKILFLSFARATVSRVVNEAKIRVPHAGQDCIEVSTYHGFAWSFIKTYSYLLTGKRPIRLFPPPEAAVHLAGVSKDERYGVMHKLLEENSLLCFDLFAGLMANVLEESPRICELLSDSYPVVIVDEFQDTNKDESRVITALGKASRIIALADPEQRIYEFRGADPVRIGEFVSLFHPTIFDFGQENNRSDGTDIVQFGNDVLSGANIGRTYSQVKVAVYNPFTGDPRKQIKYAVFGALRRVTARGTDGWSIAILVTSKEMTVNISAYLSSGENGDSAIAHETLLDPEGPSLCAVLLAGLLQGDPSQEVLEDRLTNDIINHIRGRKGSSDVSIADIELSEALRSYLTTRRIKGKNRQSLVQALKLIAKKRMDLTLSGDVSADWLNMRRLLDSPGNPALTAASEDARFIRLLNRGTQLREALCEQWRESRSYSRAQQSVADALVQEHFSNSTRAWKGVNLMTIHKSKGKEFDEVIIFEGPYGGRLLRSNASERDIEQAKLTLRVGVTRARSRTTILTPKGKTCPLI